MFRLQPRFPAFSANLLIFPSGATFERRARSNGARRLQRVRASRSAARASVLAQSGANAPCGEHAEVLSDPGVRGEQRQLLLVDLFDLVDRCVSLFGDGFLRRLVILGVSK